MQMVQCNCIIIIFICVYAVAFPCLHVINFYALLFNCFTHSKCTSDTVETHVKNIYCIKKHCTLYNICIYLTY